MSKDPPAPPPSTAQWVSTIVHDLRNPLQRISMASELLQTDDIQAKLVEKIKRATDELERTIDLLHLQAMLEAGTLVAHVEPTDLGTVVSRAVAASRQLATDRNVLAEVKAPARPSQVDPPLFQRALELLLHNAVDASPKGGTVRVYLHDDDREHLVVVRDESNPSVELNFDALFEDAYSGPRATKPGKGLGLRIAARILQAQGIALEARRAQAAGSKDLPGGVEFVLRIAQ